VSQPIERPAPPYARGVLPGSGRLLVPLDEVGVALSAVAPAGPRVEPVEIQRLIHLDDGCRPPAGRINGATARAADPWPGVGLGKLDVARQVAEAKPDRRIVWMDDDLAEQAADTGIGWPPIHTCW
jgi:hypothetical protein